MALLGMATVLGCELIATFDEGRLDGGIDAGVIDSVVLDAGVDAGTDVGAADRPTDTG